MGMGPATKFGVGSAKKKKIYNDVDEQGDAKDVHCIIRQ